MPGRSSLISDLLSRSYLRLGSYRGIIDCCSLENQATSQRNKPAKAVSFIVVVRDMDEEATKRAAIVQQLKSYQPVRSRSSSDLEDSSVAWAATKESWEDAPETPPL